MLSQDQECMVFDFVRDFSGWSYEGLPLRCLHLTAGVPDVAAQYTKRSVVFVVSPTNKSRPCGGVGFGKGSGTHCYLLAVRLFKAKLSRG